MKEQKKDCRKYHRERRLERLLFSFMLIAFIVSSAAAGRLINIRIIIVKSDSEAGEILSEIKNGKPFAFAAKEKSLDEKSRDNYGYLEKVAIEALDISLQEAVSKMNEGQTSGVIRLRDGRYAIVQIVVLKYYAEGKRAFDSKDFNAAEINLKKHIELNPDAVKARILLGQIYETKKQGSSAEEMYKEAIEFDLKNEEAYIRLGLLYQRHGKLQEAIDIYEKGQKNIPESKQLKGALETVMNKIAADVKKNLAVSALKEKAQTKNEVSRIEGAAAKEEVAARKVEVGQKTEIAAKKEAAPDVKKEAPAGTAKKPETVKPAAPEEPVKEPQPDCLMCHKALSEGTVVHTAITTAGCPSCHAGVDAREIPHKMTGRKGLLSEPPDLCYTCHDSSGFNKKVVHAPVAAGMCFSCHASHKSNNTNLILKLGNKLCRDCHRKIEKGIHVVTGLQKSGGHSLHGKKDPLRPGKVFECLSCHAPHSSDWGRLYRYEAKDEYELCLKCHQV